MRWIRFVAAAFFIAVNLLSVLPFCEAQDAQPVKVFVLAGQSNMQGHGVVDLDHEEHYNGGRGILANVLLEPRNAQLMSHVRNRKGEWTVRKDVSVRYQTEHGLKAGPLTIGFSGYEGLHHIGPEYQFGHVVGLAFDEPVLLIKTAWGGKSLFQDFRPPSSDGQTGPYYTQMLAEVEAGLENIPAEFPALKGRPVQLSGFVWMQGWNDMIDDAAVAEYEVNLLNLIRDVRAEWNAPELPVVVGELGNGGPEASEQILKFREAQKAGAENPDNGGNVAFVQTSQHARSSEDSPNTGHGHHWFGNAESYFLVGDSLGREMVNLIRGDKPRVLILGDSISIGYTPHVRRILMEHAVVIRPTVNMHGAENCAGTDKGIENIDRWLENDGGNWDVIHFNFGLHDLKHVDPETQKNSNDPEHPEQSPPEQYKQQLTEIVGKLKGTGAKLIFATTTPVPENVKPFRDPAMPARYNEIAIEIMKENEIEVNDLYSFVLPEMDETMLPNNVHFTRPGSLHLGEEVARWIQAELVRAGK